MNEQDDALLQRMIDENTREVTQALDKLHSGLEVRHYTRAIELLLAALGFDHAGFLDRRRLLRLSGYLFEADRDRDDVKPPTVRFEMTEDELIALALATRRWAFASMAIMAGTHALIERAQDA